MFAQVIPTWRTPLGLPFFDYEIPATLLADIQIGQLVTIPFRSKAQFGVIGSTSSKPTSAIKNIKPILSIVHPTALINSAQLAFLAELAELYHVSPGFLLQGNLPPLQKRKLAKLSNQENKKAKKQENNFGKPALCVYHGNKEKQEYLAQAIAQDGQTLIIVPEIVDINSLIKLLPTPYSLLTTTITSDLTEKELFDRWFQIWNGEAKIIVGTRRALFLSFHNLQSVIVDNEGHPGHKSWDMAPRFHAREAAMYLAKHHGAHFTIMSHTPSLESYYFTKHSVFTGNNYSGTPLSSALLVDMNGEKRSGNPTGLSSAVTDLVSEHTDGFILLFLNRRGSGGYIVCRDCSNVLRCPTCHRAFTFHQKNNTLACHFCKTNAPMQVSCAKCGGVQMAVYGTGTEQLERDVKKLAPASTPIIRIDSDNKNPPPITGTNGIIISTQYGWQRVPWSNTVATVFVDPDTALFIPEYHATENLWQQLHDARSRMPESSEIVIQTKHPTTPLFQYLLEPEKYYEYELTQRKIFGYPPFNYLLKLFVSDINAKQAEQKAETLYRKLALLTKNIANCTITPPLETTPMYHEKKYWYALIIKVPYAHYKRDIRIILKAVPDTWKVDLNPNTLLGW